MRRRRHDHQEKLLVGRAKVFVHGRLIDNLLSTHTFESIAVIVEFAKQCPGTRAHHGRSGSFLIELPLVAGQRLARGKVALEGRRRGTVQNGCVVRAAVSAGANKPRHGGTHGQRVYRRWGFI